MSTTLEEIPGDEVLARLNRVKDWLLEKRVEMEATRFSEILHYIDIICDHHKRNDIENLFHKFDRETLVFAFIEAGAFLEFYTAFHGMKDHLIPRRKLRDILKGPFLPRNEIPEAQNTHARNTLFELQIAAKIKNAGIDVVGFDDVDFTFEGYPFNGQCKRIHSSKMIESNVRDAIAQVTNKMNQDNTTRGIICLSIGKLAEKDNKLLEVRTWREIDPAMRTITGDFIEKNYWCWRNTINIRIVACLVYFQGVAFIGDKRLLTRCQHIEIDPIAIPDHLQATDYRVVEGLTKALGNAVPRKNVDRLSFTGQPEGAEPGRVLEGHSGLGLF